MRFLLAAPLALAATAALADPIYLNGLSQTDLAYLGRRTQSRVSTAGVSGRASDFNDTGVFTLGATDFIAGPLHANVFPANGNGTVPILYGYLGLASVNGDTAFMLQFPPGGLAQVELVLSNRVLGDQAGPRPLRGHDGSSQLSRRFCR